MPGRPSVLFICVKNGGKSQMAAGLMKDIAGDTVEVHSAGTRPGSALNSQSVQALAELGIDISAERPRAATEEALRAADVVVTLGREATVTVPEGSRYENWDTDEPSERGIEGMERMRLVRDDIRRRVLALHRELIGGRG
ncbi:low molecular weight phosphatase family protein [Arthrobacter gandavensis]|uniref:arsenate-mycothiol transferase ArsC n=1 Tax=Arthrobacter gandavensis TaxID=169960 RepID=UPI001890A576|nr:low molecular weight phosphatase family protein [Arthrobacter gandavensis]MBF4992747.1 low molecular weight phosphatase family protein [Arthrobacter gandavensis]